MGTVMTINAFINHVVKETDYGPPSAKGIQSLKDRLQYLSAPLLRASQNTGLTVYLLNAGQDPVGAGRELFDPRIFPLPEDQIKINEALSGIESIDKKYQSWRESPTSREIYALYCKEIKKVAEACCQRFGILGINPFNGITDLLIGMPRLAPQTTLGALAANRIGSDEDLEYIRFLTQLRDGNPHLFIKESTYQWMASVAIHEFPARRYCVVPDYKYVESDTGRKCVLRIDADERWKWKDARFISCGGGLTKMRGNKPAIYLTSPVHAPEKTYNQNIPVHELTHLWDVRLKKQDSTFHDNLYHAAAETIKQETRKGESQRKLSSVLAGYDIWANTSTPFIEQWQQPWSPQEACKELIGYTGGFVFSRHPDQQLKILKECNRQWASTFQGFLSRVESLAD